MEGQAAADVNLASLCEKYGGGGHARVAAISLAPEDLARARQVAQGNCRNAAPNEPLSSESNRASVVEFRFARSLGKSPGMLKCKSSLWAASSMVEQLTLNQRVVGSSPPRLTNFFSVSKSNTIS